LGKANNTKPKLVEHAFIYLSAAVEINAQCKQKGNSTFSIYVYFTPLRLFVFLRVFLFFFFFWVFFFLSGIGLAWGNLTSLLD